MRAVFFDHGYRSERRKNAESEENGTDGETFIYFRIGDGGTPGQDVRPDFVWY